MAIWQDFKARKVTLGVHDMPKVLITLDELAYELEKMVDQRDDVKLQDLDDTFKEVGAIALTLQACVTEGKAVLDHLDGQLEEKDQELEDLRDQILTLQAQLLGILPAE